LFSISRDRKKTHVLQASIKIIIPNQVSVEPYNTDIFVPKNTPLSVPLHMKSLDLPDESLPAIFLSGKVAGVNQTIRLI
jgi:hypothetical protein